MSGKAQIEITAQLVPRHFQLNINCTLNGTAAMELVQLLSVWEDESAGGLVGAIRAALVEANGGREIELPQPVVAGEEDDDDEDGGTPAKIGK